MPQASGPRPGRHPAGNSGEDKSERSTLPRQTNPIARAGGPPLGIGNCGDWEAAVEMPNKANWGRRTGFLETCGRTCRPGGHGFAPNKPNRRGRAPAIADSRGSRRRDTSAWNFKQTQLGREGVHCGLTISDREFEEIGQQEVGVRNAKQTQFGSGARRAGGLGQNSPRCRLLRRAKQTQFGCVHLGL
jgi:hypothetical protein